MLPGYCLNRKSIHFRLIAKLFVRKFLSLEWLLKLKCADHQPIGALILTKLMRLNEIVIRTQLDGSKKFCPSQLVLLLRAFKRRD